jgi:hypothetical protein
VNCLICPDESEFQPIITNKFGRRVLILRAAFGAHYEDKHFLSNAVVADWLYRHGVIDGVILYQVYLASATPQEQYAFLWKLIGPTIPDWLIGIMIDLEHWAGTSYAITGNQSKPINTLYALNCHRLGTWNGCGLYGNRGDLASLAPQRDSRMWVIVAAYGSSLIYKSVKGAIGQQYSDGSSKWPVPSIGGAALPRSTSGVSCDHNVFDPPRFPTGVKLRAFMRPTTARPPTKPSSKPPANPPAVKPYYRAATAPGTALVSPNRTYAAFLADDGRIDIRHSGTHVRYL